MAQLLPAALRDPEAALVGADQSVVYGESWVWHHGDACACIKSYPHLFVIGSRAVRTEGVATLEEWVRFALNVERYAYPIYSTDFGVEFAELIARSATRAEAETEVVRMATEALLVDPRVVQVRRVILTDYPEVPAAVLLDIEVVTFTADVQQVSLLANLEV